jgi:hypothetical protein
MSSCCIAWPQVEVERLAALVEGGTVSPLELTDADVAELRAERFPARFGQRE